MDLLSEKHSPKPFAHPAFFRPENEWMTSTGSRSPNDVFLSKKRVSRTCIPEWDVEVYLLGDWETTLTRVTTVGGWITISTYSRGDFNEVVRHEHGLRVWTEFRIKDKLIKKETVLNHGFKAKNDELEEVWYSEFNGRSEPVAIRRTKAGVLSCESEPAVVIRLFNPCIERQEFWKDGVLSKVQIVSEQEILVEERWEKGVIQTRKWSSCLTERIVNGAAVLMSYSNHGSVWDIPVKPVEVPPAPEKVPTKSISILTLEDATKMLLEKSIEKFNSKAIKRMCKGKTFLTIKFADEVRNEMKKVIEQAGYVVVKPEGGSLRMRVSLV